MGRLVHFEFLTDDPAELTTFYERVFGWETQRWGEEPYWLMVTGPEAAPGIDGAIAPPSPVTDQRVITTIDVDDLDAAVERAVDAGGRVLMPKQPIPGVGWLSYLEDPAGIVIGAMQADEAAG